MVVRAPKGDVEPMFFTPQNEAVIHAMIGLPTADWPDINEAVAFNREYGLYISAPAGSSDEYPSTYGGVYITKRGALPFYNCTDKTEPGFITAITAGTEKEGYGAPNNSIAKVTHLSTKLVGASSVTGANSQEAQGGITISKIHQSVWANTNYIVLEWANKIYKFVKSSNDLVLVGADGAVTTKKFGEWTQDADGYKVTLGRAAGLTTSTDPLLPNLDFTLISKDYASLFVGSPGDFAELESTNPDDWGVPYIVNKDAINQVTMAEVKEYLTNGAGIKLMASYPVARSIERPIDQIVKFEIDVKNDTYAYIVQKSPTEKTTQINISHIGYNKYRYNLDLEYIWAGQIMMGQTIKDVPSMAGGVLDLGATGADFNSKDDNGLFVAVFLDLNKGTVVTDKSNYSAIIVKKEEVPTGGKSYKRFNNVTSDYLTQIVRTRENIKFAGIGQSVPTVGGTTPGTDMWNDDLFTFDTVPGFFQANPIPDPTYNSITFTLKEEIYPGQLTGGGEFNGSLAEDGVDSYGANIFLPNVLPDDSLSYCEVNVLRTFDDDTNIKGFFTGTPIIDAIGPGPNNKLCVIKGSRYITNLTNEFIRNNGIGSIVDGRIVTILKQGWAEAGKTKYDECYIMMEPTGDENFKPILSSLREVQKLTTFIAPKQITKAQFVNPNTITVAARKQGFAQYIGEFLVKDPYTAKKYYCQPIGDVGLNLARIIDKKMGGWAPMWNNISGGLGGQLDRNVLKAKWDFDDRSTQIMDEKGVNPIIYNADDGVMIVSQKNTAPNPDTTDWSYLGHSMAFDLCKREIRDNVMRAQIGKPNDAYWQNIRQQQVDAILAKRISGSQPIWTAAKCEIAGVNTDTVKAQRKFVIKVQVKVTIFSEIVELLFENVSQTTNL